MCYVPGTVPGIGDLVMGKIDRSQVSLGTSVPWPPEVSQHPWGKVHVPQMAFGVLHMSPGLFFAAF